MVGRKSRKNAKKNNAHKRVKKSKKNIYIGGQNNATLTSSEYITSEDIPINTTFLQIMYSRSLNPKLLLDVKNNTLF